GPGACGAAGCSARGGRPGPCARRGRGVHHAVQLPDPRRAARLPAMDPPWLVAGTAAGRPDCGIDRGKGTLAACRRGHRVPGPSRSLPAGEGAAASTRDTAAPRGDPRGEPGQLGGVTAVAVLGCHVDRVSHPGQEAARVIRTPRPVLLVLASTYPRWADEH